MAIPRPRRGSQSVRDTIAVEVHLPPFRLPVRLTPSPSRSWAVNVLVTIDRKGTDMAYKHFEHDFGDDDPDASWETITANRHGGNAHSLAAAASISRSARTSIQNQVLGFITDQPAGATYEEVAIGLNLYEATVSSVISVLKKHGFVDVGGYRRTSRGKMAAVYLPTGTSIMSITPTYTLAAVASVPRRARAAIRDRVKTRVLDFIRDHPDGVTYEDVMVGLDLCHPTVTSAISNLKKNGLVQERGERPTSRGRMAAVYVVPGKGLLRAGA